MKLNHYKIRSLNINDLKDIIEIFKSNYMIEDSCFERFVSFDDIEKEAAERLSHMLVNNSGWAITLDEKLVGYLVGFEVGPLFGKDLGVVVPLHGHGSILKDKNTIYQLLFEHAAAYWIKKDIFSMAITMFAHDEGLKSFWFENGFGMRCVDAIRNLDDIDIKNENVRIKLVTEDDIDDVLDLHEKHNLSYRQSPIFMPNEDEDPKEDLILWLKNKNRYLFVAYKNDCPVGYMRIQEQGESVISSSKYMMSITGAYVSPSYRNQNIASMLLSHIVGWLKNHKYRYLGVDFESINPNANVFWHRYFTPYTISLTRRFDERIVSLIYSK